MSKFIPFAMRRMLLVLAAICFSNTVLFAWDDRRSDPNNFRPNNTKVKFSESKFPIVLIDVGHKVIQKDSKILATVKVINNADGLNYADLKAHPNQHLDFDGYVAIKYRGTSSYHNSPKKPYSIRPLVASEVPTKGVDAKKEKVVMLGMGKKGDNDWCLLAPWEDKSYMRDLLTLDLSRNYFDYAPQGKYCEVVLDGIYYGLYIMSERCTKGKDRLNLNDPGEDGDFSGDWHVYVDRDEEDNYYTSKYHPENADGTPKWDKYVYYQYKDFEKKDFLDKDYLAKYPGMSPIDSLHAALDAMEDALHAKNFKDPEKGYRKYIDVTSWIDYQITTEFTGNIDGYRLSTTLYKYSTKHAKKLGKSSKWKMAPWDYNIAYGNSDYYDSNADIMRYETNYLMNPWEKWQNPFWWTRLMTDDSYVRELKERWTLCRSEHYRTDSIMKRIDDFAGMLKSSKALERDNKAWSNHFGSIDHEVKKLKDFIIKRLAFLDKHWLLPTGVSSVPVENAAGTEAIYSIDGRKQTSLQRGLNIVRSADGRVRKVLVK